MKCYKEDQSIINGIIPQIFWEDRLHPADRARILASLEVFLTMERSADWEVEYRFKKGDGEYAHVYDRGHFIFNANKRHSRMIGATQDITIKKNAELKLFATERNLVQQRVKNQKEIIAAVLRAQEKERSEIGKELLRKTILI